MENKTTPYILRKDGNYFVFPSEGAACEYLDVKPCSVASCFRSGSKCKGYEVIRAYSELDLYNDSRLRKIWESMHERCEYQRHPHFKDYGGRGIKVCEAWDSYLPFAKWAMKNGYSQDLTIDRIDGNKGYCPSNCRWVTQKEQQNNKRSNHKIKYNGEIRNLSEWADMYGIGRTTLRERLKCGWSIEKALSTPVRQYSADMREPNLDATKGDNHD